MDEEKRKSVERGYKELKDGHGEVISDNDNFLEELRRETNQKPDSEDKDDCL